MITLMLQIVLMSGLDQDQWFIKDTGIIQPLLLKEVIISPVGETYILNFDDALIRHYDAGGTHRRTFGGKGQGPGEFTFPMNFFYFQEKVYVVDTLQATVSIFNNNGDFLKRSQLPGRGLTLVKASVGWYYGNWGEFGRTKMSQLFWADDEFQQVEEVMDIKNEGFSKGFMVMRRGGKRDARFGPFENRPILKRNSDGSKIFLTDTQSFKIHVIDATAKKVAHVIQRNIKRIPFDPDWADAILEQKLKDRTRPLNAKLTKVYPSHFPVINQLMITPDDHLLVDCYQGKPDNPHYQVVMDTQGVELPQKNWGALNRLAGIYNGYGFVTVYDEEEEKSGLAKIPLNKLTTFIENNPINCEDCGGRTLIFN